MGDASQALNVDHMTSRYFRISHVAEFFLAVDDIPTARPGRIIDALPHRGGVTLFLGRRFALTLDINAIHAFDRWRAAGRSGALEGCQ